MNLFAQKLRISVAILFLCLSSANVKSFPADNQGEDGDGDYEDAEEVEAGDDPEFISTSQKKEALVGEDLVLPCQVNKLEGLTWFWSVKYSEAKAAENPQILFLGTRRTSGPDRITVNVITEGNEQEGSTLTIKNLSLSDSGTYICTVATEQPIKVEFEVQVHQSKTDFQMDANNEQDTLTNKSTSDAASTYFISVPMVVSLTLLQFIRW